VIEEKPHAEGFGPLHCHQAHLSTDMIAVCKLGYQRFIVLGIALQAGDPFFDHTAKAGANLEPFIGGDIGDHLQAPRSGNSEAENNFFTGLNFFLLVPILGKTNVRR